MPSVWYGAQMLAIYASDSYRRRPPAVSRDTELRRLEHANAYKDRVLAGLHGVIHERDRGIEWLRGELDIARNKG